jgi:hypothetical protein
LTAVKSQRSNVSEEVITTPCPLLKKEGESIGNTFPSFLKEGTGVVIISE